MSKYHMKVVQYGSGQICCKMNDSFIETDYHFSSVPVSFRTVNDAMKEALYDKYDHIFKDVTIDQMKQICDIVGVTYELPADPNEKEVAT